MSAPTAAQVFRDYVTDGVPSSGKNKVKKSEARIWGRWLESFIAAVGANSGSVFTTRDLLDADLAHAANEMAWVVQDPTVTYNGIYQKQGASGSGSWVRVGDLPYSFITATDAGAGTPNAIQATSEQPVSESALVVLNVFMANTSSPVTIAFNGGDALTIKSNSGNDIVPGGLVADMRLLGVVSDSTFRLVSDQASSAVVAAAEAAAADAGDEADRAELAKTAAESAAGSNLAYADTRSSAMLITMPGVVSYIRTAGYSLVGDGGAALYKRVGSQPSHVGKFQTADGAWWEIVDDEISPAKVGVLTSPNIAPAATYPSFSAGPGDQTAAMQAWLDAPGYKKISGGRKTIRLDGGLVIPAANLDTRKIDLGNTVFDCSRIASGTTVLTASASISATRALAANALAGAYSVTPSTGAGGVTGLTPGMMVRIGSNAVFDATSTSSRIGELNWIDSIVGSVVNLKLPLRDNYITTDAAFIQWVTTPLSGIEVMGGEFFGPSTVQDGCNGISLYFCDRPKIIGTRINWFDQIAIAFRSCFDGIAEEVYVTEMDPNTQGYGVSYFDASRGGRASGSFRDVRHAASTNNTVATEWGIPRDIVFHDMHALYSAPAASGVGGAAFDAHTAADNISYIDCIAEGATGCGLSVECPTAAVRNFKAINSQNTVAAVLFNNKSDRSGAYEVSGVTVRGSAGAGIRAQSDGGQVARITLTDFYVSACVSHSIFLSGVTQSYVADGISITTSGMSAVSCATMDRSTIGPYTAIGGAQSTQFFNSVTNSMIIKGADSSSGGVAIGAGAGNSQK